MTASFAAKLGRFLYRKLRSLFGKNAIELVRNEYTVMPRFGYHQPLDYDRETWPPRFEPYTTVPGEAIPIPPAYDRYGYSPNDSADYLRWGRADHDLIVKTAGEFGGIEMGAHILDFGCSSGRVLRHFETEHQSSRWVLHGVDVQARPIEWMRQFFPQHFQVYTGTVLPHLPFPDEYFDLIYGFSVFTHIKYLWDAWLLELRRVLKAGGLLIQTIHAEEAWTHYHKNRNEEYVRTGLPKSMLSRREMDVDFFYFGDIAVSQVFWKRETARKYWGRYFEVLDLRKPPERSFQDWIICRKR